MNATTWRWACLRCGDGGPADSAGHATALERTHQHYACPKAPGLRHPPPPAPGSTFVPWDELASREAWHKIMMERYGPGWPQGEVEPAPEIDDGPPDPDEI